VVIAFLYSRISGLDAVRQYRLRRTCAAARAHASIGGRESNTYAGWEAESSKETGRDEGAPWN
jgi:hypothetical protein